MLHFFVTGGLMVLYDPTPTPPFEICAYYTQCTSTPNPNGNAGLTVITYPTGHGTFEHPDGPSGPFSYTWIGVDPTTLLWYKGTLTGTAHWHTRFFRTGPAYYFVIESGQVNVTDQYTVAILD
jgi:hypothetical protein